MAKITTLIFDWGGVLAPDSIHMATKFFSTKYNLNESEVYKTLYNEEDFSRGEDSDPYYEHVGKKLGIPAEEIKDVLIKQNEWEVINFARDLKKKGFNLYLLSDQMKPKADAIIFSHHLDFFDELFFSNEIGHIKTERKAFEILMEKIGKKPDECVFIDDRSINIENAQSVGLNTVLFDSLLDLILELKNKYGVELEKK